MMNVICKSKSSVVTKVVLLAAIFGGLIVTTTIRAEVDAELQELMWQKDQFILQPITPELAMQSANLQLDQIFSKGRRFCMPVLLVEPLPES